MKELERFIRYAAGELGLRKIPEIHFVGHEEDVNRAFGHFQHSDDAIKVRSVDRHPLDVMRTVAHEMAHYKWRLEGKVGDNVAGGKSENYAHARAGEIMRNYDSTHPKAFKDRPIREDGGAFAGVATNAMGSSSSTPGTGAIDTVDPFLGKKRLRNLIKRTPLRDIKR